MDLDRKMYTSFALMLAALGAGFMPELLVLSVVLAGLSATIAIYSYIREVHG